MTELLIIAAIAVVCAFVVTVFVTVTFRQALRDMSRMMIAQSVRHNDQMSALLDRLQTIRWEDLVALRSIDDTPDGGFLTPEEQREEQANDETEVTEQVRWGPLSRLRATQGANAAEQALLDEDFPDDYPTPTEHDEAETEVRNAGR